MFHELLCLPIFISHSGAKWEKYKSEFTKSLLDWYLSKQRKAKRRKIPYVLKSPI